MVSRVAVLFCDFSAATNADRFAESMPFVSSQVNAWYSSAETEAGAIPEALVAHPELIKRTTVKTANDLMFTSISFYLANLEFRTPSWPSSLPTCTTSEPPAISPMVMYALKK